MAAPQPDFQKGLTDYTEATPSRIIFGYFLAGLMGCLGAMAGGFIGYVYSVGGNISLSRGNIVLQPGGMPPIFGFLIGFALFFALTWCYAGPGEYHYNSFIATVKPPSVSRMQTVGLQSFDLYVTVHRVKNVYNTDPILGLFGFHSNPYVEVMAGRCVEGEREFKMNRNTIQRTCVARHNQFEEVFHFNVSPTDDTIRFVLYDQDLVTDDLVGMCEVNISEEVLNQAFPQKVAYKMHRCNQQRLLRRHGDQDAFIDAFAGDANKLAGSIVVSFAPGEHFPMGAGKRIKSKSPSGWQHLQTAHKQMASHSVKTAGKYGTWATAASIA